MSACASFLKPLLGRVLKLNTTIDPHGYYRQQYKVSRVRAGFGTATIGGGGGGTRNRARADVTTMAGSGNVVDVGLRDHHMRKSAALRVRTSEQQLHPPQADAGVVFPATTLTEAKGGRLGLPSPTTSTDMILAEGAGDRAISCTREFRVMYSEK